jgi:uncharacterized membrane protein YcaP (DUF421 family)
VFDLGTPWWAIIVRTAVVYVVVLAGLRLTGKRQIGQMAPFDLVLILLIANAVQNAMVGSDTSLLGGLIAAVVLLLLNLGVARVNQAIPMFQKLTEGGPVVLVSDGRVIEAALRHEGIDEVELEEAIREHAVRGLDEVELAVLEVDGSISVVPKDRNVIRTRRRFHRAQRHG